MTTTVAFQRTRPQQATSIYTQQTTAQQTGGIDISTLMNLVLPAIVIGMMAKMMSSTLGKPIQVKSAKGENIISQTKKTTTAG